MKAPILYIEDEEDYQILVKRILNRAGLQVTIAETGAEGLERMRQERPSLLILDINLPDRDGYSLCHDLRQDPSWVDLPILVLTVRRRPEEWLRGFSSGANDYISKPLNPPELIERVVHGMEGRCHPFTETANAEYSLIQAAAAGNRAAFEVLIQKYKGRVLDGLRHLVPNNAVGEDAVAQAFVLAFEKLRDFRGQASFYTWVYRIALNEVLHAYRRPSALSVEELGKEGDGGILASATCSEPLETTVEEKELRTYALELLHRLPRHYREILELYFLQDLSYEEIAKKLKIPEGTVMSRLHKARKLLQNSWDFVQ